MGRWDIRQANVAVERLIETTQDPRELVDPLIRPLPDFDAAVV